MATGKRIAKKEEKHQLILEVAEKLMAKKGLYALNMDEIATLAKLAKGTLYLYFKSKEEIFAALAFKSRVLLLEEFEKAIAQVEQPIEQLKAIIMANYHFLKSNSLYYDLVSFYEIDERETETPEMMSVTFKITELVITVIKNGQHQGNIDIKIDPLALAFSMWGMTVGIMQLLKVKTSIINNLEYLSENEILANYISIFEKGIKK